jgi:hypothetical protein
LSATKKTTILVFLIKGVSKLDPALNPIEKCMSLVHMTKTAKDHKEATKKKGKQSPFHK